MISARAWVEGVALAVAATEVPDPGALSLAEFQADAARRLAEMIRVWGGALLADAVGLGKTRVALAVAATIARERRIAGARGSVWCCVPARLRTSWRLAAEQAGLEVTVVTHAAMSRGRVPSAAPLMVVVDEAHRFRNVGTNRRQALAAVSGAPLLLLTATPVANSAADLFNLVRLFLDDDDVRRSFGWDLDTAQQLVADGECDAMELLAAVTVRRTEPPAEQSFSHRPAARLRVVAYEPSAAEQWVWSNLEREVRRLNLADESEDWPRGLFVEHVLRRWESGPDALADTLRDLEMFVARRMTAAAGGRTLDRTAFREIFGGERAQEVFGFLYPRAHVPPPRAAMAADLERLQVLRSRVAEVCHGMFGRDELIARIACEPEPLLVFTSYQRAAEGLFQRICTELGPRGRVGLITGRRATATGLGRVPPEELLARFAPRAHGRAFEPHQQLQVLVATDCIAEGVNLQDCGRVVLADLPYSPLGVEQRVGRLLRAGSRHPEVQIYLPRPSNWNDSLGMRRRLSEKLSAAEALGFGQNRSDAFATLTELERIAARARGRAPPPLPSAMRLTARPTGWLVFARVCGSPWIFTVGTTGSVRELLGELAWSEAEAEVCAPGSEVVAALDARRALLLAAWQAPAAVALDDPQALAWQLLLAEAARGALDPAELPCLRARLLRRHRLGVRRQIAALLSAQAPDRLAAYVASLDGPGPGPQVELVTALGL